MWRFHTKTQYKVHSGFLEAAAVIVMPGWLLRSPEIHNTRFAALIDARAATLRNELRRILQLLSVGASSTSCVPSASKPTPHPEGNLFLAPGSRDIAGNAK